MTEPRETRAHCLIVPGARTGEAGVVVSDTPMRSGRVTVTAPVVATEQLLVSLLSATPFRSSAQASRKYVLLLVEQNVHHSLRLAHRVHVLESGWVVRSGTPEELRQDKAIQQAYLGL